MKKLILVIILFLSIPVTIQAQEEIQEQPKDSVAVDDPNEFNFNFGSVKKIDFEVEVEDTSDEFDAVYVFNKQFVYFHDYVGQIRKVHKRIRIENEEGLAYATRNIDLYIKEGSRKEKLAYLKGATYNMVDGEIVKTKLKKDAIFHEDSNEYYKEVSFTMPDVQVGSVIEYSYQITSKTYVLDDINLQYQVPVINAEIDVSFPERAAYNVVFNPRAKYKLNFNASDFGDAISSSSIKTEDDEEFGADFEAEQLRISNKSIGFTSKNIPALKPEQMSGGFGKYRAKMIINLAAILDSDGDVEKEFADSWEDVATTIYDEDDFGKAIRKTGFYKSDLENALVNITDNNEKVNTIYNLVKSKVKWNGRYGVYATDGLKESYKSGSGKVGDVNLLLVSILREAGIEAYPVLVSSVDNDMPVFPTVQGFNYVIAQAVVDGEKILLDATEKYARPGFIPLRAANWKGRLIKKDGSSEWVKLTNNQESQEIILLNVTFDEDGLIKGNGKKRLSNYMALSSRNRNVNSTDEEIQDYLKGDNVGLEIESVEVKDLESDKKHLTFDYDITYKNGIDKIGDKFYVTPLLYESNEENPFKLETRELPLDLSFPIETKTIVNITIPDGYELESLPESVLLIYNENKGSYKYITKVTGNRINTIATFSLNQSVILPQDYKSFKDFFESIVVKDAEKIVLKKI